MNAPKPGLPLVIAEFGWYGGGPLTPNGKPATEEQQSEWCRHLLEVTSPMACGWLNWGMYDHPQAKDVSKLTGLFTVDGKEKAWGRAFRDAGAAVPGQSPAVRDPQSPRPAVGGLHGQRRRDGEVPPGLPCGVRCRMEGPVIYFTRLRTTRVKVRAVTSSLACALG